MSTPNRPHPPRWAVKLLEWYCAPHLLEEVQGDLEEEFDYQVQLIGERRARLDYVRNVLGFIRPFALKRKATHHTTPSVLDSAMLRNYLTIACRTLWRSRGYTAINVVGLSVAFCICIYLFLMAYLQLTFDSFHQDADRIFQTYFFANDPQGASRQGSMPMPLMPALKTEYPEVEAAVRFRTERKNLVAYKGKFLDKEVYYTDPDFFKIFSFPLVKGNRTVALQSVNGIVITESLAKAIFGNEEPLGKELLVGSIGNQKRFQVTGVAADVPYNSSIRFEALIRIENAPNYHADQANWVGNSHQVFIKLAPAVEKDLFEKRLQPFAQKYLPAKLESLKSHGARPDERGDVFAVRLQPLTAIHFDQEISGGKGAPIVLIYMLIGIASFILLIASINFINLSIARSFTRAREMGVRKTLGALNRQLFTQIWGEAVLICLTGLLVGSLLAYMLLPAFNATFGTRLQLGHLLQPGYLALMLGVFALVTFLAGGYPAWQLVKLHPVSVLKGKILLKQPGLLRNSLLVTQFVISSLFTCCTVIALQQLDYLREQPLGFQTEQVISIPVGNHANGRQVLQRLRNTLGTDPNIRSITGSGVNLGKGKDRITSRTVIGFTYKGKEIATDWLLVDFDYLKTLNIPLLAGREFNRVYATDSVNRVIITESLAKRLGEKQPIGQVFQTDTAAAPYQIIGVVPDFNLYSATSDALPITMHLSANEPIHYVFVRVTPQQLSRTMNKVKKAWQEVAPQAEFMGSFLDENINGWYENEEKLAQLFTLASGITILLSCIGLFAVALLLMEQRTKEIGIRKVLGASIASIIVVLSKDFVRLVIIALAIALPLAWFLVQQWLASYTHRVPVSGWVFVGVGLFALLVALATISFQSIRAAMANPAKSLRSE